MCMYACIYICMYVCLHMYMRICMDVYICVRVCACVRVYIYVYMYVCIYIYVSLYHVYVQFVSFRIGEWGWGGVQLVHESACCLAWGAIVDRRKDSGIVCVFSIFNAGGSVCVCECVYTHTHTHTAQIGCSDVLDYRKWHAFHLSCVGTKAHLQTDRKHSDTVNLYPWEFQSGKIGRASCRERV